MFWNEQRFIIQQGCCGGVTHCWGGECVQLSLMQWASLVAQRMLRKWLSGLLYCQDFLPQEDLDKRNKDLCRAAFPWGRTPLCNPLTPWLTFAVWLLWCLPLHQITGLCMYMSWSFQQFCRMGLNIPEHRWGELQRKGTKCLAINICNWASYRTQCLSAVSSMASRTLLGCTLLNALGTPVRGHILRHEFLWAWLSECWPVFSIPQITEKMTSCKPMATAMDSAMNGVLCGYVADPLVRTSSFKKRRHIK